MTFLEDLFARRAPINVGGNPHRFIELVGGREVPLISYEPDPVTFRDKYYYNTRLNSLFLKVEAFNPCKDRKVFYWKKVNEY
jgi:hypothetical protein